MTRRARLALVAERFRKLHPLAWGNILRGLGFEWEVVMRRRRLIRETIREYEDIPDLDDLDDESGGDEEEDNKEIEDDG